MLTVGRSTSVRRHLRRQGVRGPDRRSSRPASQIVVGTPGRLIDLLEPAAARPARTRRRSSCSTRPTRCSTSGSCPTSRRSSRGCRARGTRMLFSATMPGAVVALARRFMSQPDRTSGPTEPATRASTAGNIKQLVYRAHALDKVEVIARVLQADGRGQSDRSSRAPSARPPSSADELRATAASPPAPCTATSARGPASRRWRAFTARQGRRARSRPTSPPAASTSRA